MASESALLGTAAIYINNMVPELLLEQEKEFGIISVFTGFEGILDRVDELLDRPELKSETKKLSERLINSKCDVTAFLVSFVEEWPESFERYKTEKGINKTLSE